MFLLFRLVGVLRPTNFAVAMALLAAAACGLTDRRGAVWRLSQKDGRSAPTVALLQKSLTKAGKDETESEEAKDKATRNKELELLASMTDESLEIHGPSASQSAAWKEYLTAASVDMSPNSAKTAPARKRSSANPKRRGRI